ncbi:MAG TPA: sarcosine oxidase subunit alpha family protein [Afifellaceae bacterium]|nr:sarcosine oxidase subunit alpha family protein [Afifellaceae bacterium]
MAGYRLAEGGGRIDRSKPLRFGFDGETITGFAGDTVASALLASGRMMVARSFKYHRPRGVFSAGAEEPNALVTIGEGAETTPNVQATLAEAVDGLVVRSQNAWPSLDRDVGALSGLLSPFLGAGFYYKTFIGPFAGAWMLYEPIIRRAAGMGAAAREPDPGRYEHAQGFCDVLVVGGGPAGLAAALAVGRGGARVILADENAEFGGTSVLDDATIDGSGTAGWVRTTVAELTELENVRLLRRTAVYGYYDGNVLAATERPPADDAAAPRERHWRIQARRVVLATGAMERPIVFAGNDTPGVMLLGYALAYARHYGVAVGNAVAVFANNDAAWHSAAALAEAGVTIKAIIDPRDSGPDDSAMTLRAAGATLYTGHIVTAAEGGKAVSGIVVAQYDLAGENISGGAMTIPCDALLVSGGWTPNVNLASQAGGPPVFDSGTGAFIPGTPREAWTAAGAMTGKLTLNDALESGAEAGSKTVNALKIKALRMSFTVENQNQEKPFHPLHEVPSNGHGKAFVDMQHDVKASDVRLARREGFSALEHLKRYTTLGMAADQGRTSNVNALAIMAAEESRPIAEVGTTRFRPPYRPVTFGAIVGRATGRHFQPLRRTPMHDWHENAGAEMINVGQWQRPRVYRRPGEGVEDATIREARAVRSSLGITDISTLGKIDIQGPDAATFLDRVFTNTFSSLPVGKARYGLVLRDDGFLYDDGTTWRLSDARYLMTTTTSNAAGVMALLEFLLAVDWPELKVALTSVTEQWAGVAIAGPRARDLLAKAISDVDFSSKAFPVMGVRTGRLGDIDVLISRLSFSGELAFEVYCGADFGLSLWTTLLEAGEAFDCTPYGLEALGALRIEKGHVTHDEMDGRTSVHDLGLDRMFSKKKAFVGKPMALRAALTDPGRKRLVGLKSLNGKPVRAGAQLVAGSDPNLPGGSQGHVTSMAYSVAIDTYIALGLLERGPERHGETLYAADPVRGSHGPVEVCAPCFYDPDGSRMHG